MVLLLSCTRERDKSAAKAQKRKSVLHTFCFPTLLQRIFLCSWKMKKQCAYYVMLKYRNVERIYEKYTYVHLKRWQNHCAQDLGTCVLWYYLLE